jgi:phosphopantothenoylcysteine decarboxylase/phosphopantothenate--cysteine ligase
MVIAPLSANTLSKMASGACDNILLAIYLSATCPIIVAPAMDEDMWKHPSTKNNLAQIQSFGNYVLPVEHGELASGLIGEGRMAEPEQIINWLHQYFSTGSQLEGRHVLITAGPTYEAIDPVRYIGNHSTGKMGIAIATEFINRGATVTLVCGPVAIPIPENINLIKVTSAKEMYQACMEVFQSVDIAVMSAAVADFSLDKPSNNKIKKEEHLQISLTKTDDILKSLGAVKKTTQILVGFALETNNEKENAIKKMQSKNADYIVLNSMNDDGAGFGFDSNKITIFDRFNHEYQFDKKAKTEVAKDIVNTILNSKNA